MEITTLSSELHVYVTAEEVNLTFFTSTMHHMNRSLEETLEKTLIRMTKILEKGLGGKGKSKKGKNKGKSNTLPAPPVVPLEGMSSIPPIAVSPSSVAFMVLNGDEEVDVSSMTNQHGWQSGMKLVFPLLEISFIVVLDAPIVRDINTFPGATTCVSYKSTPKGTCLMINCPITVDVKREHADSMEIAWYIQPNGGDSKYEYKCTSLTYTPSVDDLDCKLKIFVTPMREQGSVRGRSMVHYLTGKVQEEAESHILYYRALYNIITRERNASISQTLLASEAELERTGKKKFGKHFLSFFAPDASTALIVQEKGEGVDALEACRVTTELRNASKYLSKYAKKRDNSVYDNEQSIRPGNLFLVDHVRDCTATALLHSLTTCTDIDSSPSSLQYRNDRCLRLVNYNILSDGYSGREYARKVLYPYCSPEYLVSEYRLQLIGKEILAYDSDVCCLQEVDRKAYLCYLQPLMSAQGYTGHFTMKDTSVNEGVANFVHHTFGQVMMYIDIPLGKSIVAYGHLDSVLCKEEYKGCRDILNEFLGMVAQVVVVKKRNVEACNDEYVIFANTHLFFHPAAPYIRLLQTDIIAKALHAVSEFMTKHYHENTCPLSSFTFPAATVIVNDHYIESESSRDRKTHLIFCGDLNSTLETAVLEYLERGVIASDHVVWKSALSFDWFRGRDDEGEGEREGEEGSVGGGKEGGETEEVANVSTEWPALHNPLGPLSSAAGYPQYTNWIAGFHDVLDYIYVKDTMRVIRQAPFPSEQDFIEMTGIPNESYPSDHLALAVDLELL